MITLLIAIAVASGVFSVFHFAVGLGLGWSITLGIVSFIAFQVIVGLQLRKRVMRDMERVQAILLDGQKKIQAKTQAWQWRPPSSIAAAQKEIFEDTKVFVKEALAQTETLRRYRLWVPMIDRQIATAQLQLNWMVKDFKRVDELMPKALMMDPAMVAMKLARQYSNGAAVEEIEKTYRKARLRLRYNQSAFLSSVMAWIYVKRDRLDEAHRLLDQACKDNNTEQEPGASLVRNRDALANNRVKQFSNAAFADQWYALFLEEPKVRYERRAPARFGRFG